MQRAPYCEEVKLPDWSRSSLTIITDFQVLNKGKTWVKHTITELNVWHNTRHLQTFTKKCMSPSPTCKYKGS